MSQATQRTYEQAVALHRAGRLADAEVHYRRVQAVLQQSQVPVSVYWSE